jgi:hypothetical protein
MKLMSLNLLNCGSSSAGRATAFQAVGRGFEPRLPLNLFAKRMASICQGRRSSGVERFLGKEEVMGSNPIVGSNYLYYNYIK